MAESAEPTVQDKVTEAVDAIEAWVAILMNLTSPKTAADVLKKIAAEARELQPRAN